MDTRARTSAPSTELPAEGSGPLADADEPLTAGAVPPPAADAPAETSRSGPAGSEVSYADLSQSDTAQPGTARIVLEWVGVLVPFTTILTALAFWFGWTLTNARSRYLGVDASVFEFSPTDYMLRSADAVIVPIIVVCLVGIAWLGVLALVLNLMRSGRRIAGVRLGAQIGLVVATMGLVIAVRAMFVPMPAGTWYLLAPLLLGGSAALAATAIAVLRRSSSRPPTKDTRMWARSSAVLSATLVVISLFWAATLYADALGRGRGMDVERQLDQLPATTVFSAMSLGLGDPVTETVIEGADAQYRYRYDGLRLLLRSADTYFLLPEGWRHGSGAVIVLHDTSDIRMEFTAGR